MKHLCPFAFPFWGLFAVLCLTACSPNSDSSDASGPATVDTYLPLRINEVDLRAQIALSMAEQRKGLMHRESLPKDSGMLFPYRKARRLSFWMANTPLALDIGFFNSNGLLREVHRMAPFDTNRTTSTATDLRYALEMPAGWFSENDLYPGARLDLDLLAEALRRRGADPADFGLED